MKREPRYWNDDWGIAVGPQILEYQGEFVQVSEVANILKRDVFRLARLPHLCNLSDTEIHSYTYGRPQDIPVYYHNKWIELNRDHRKLAEHSLMLDEIMHTDDSGVRNSLDMNWILEQPKATDKQLKYLLSLMKKRLVLDVERIRVETFLREEHLTRKRVSRLIQYFVGVKVPKVNGGYEYQVKGVLQERSQQ